jgi:prophage antirepressor-like protein
MTNSNLVSNLENVFNFEEKQLRIFGSSNEPWFCSKDVCNILEYKDVKKALKNHVDFEYVKNLIDIFKGGNSPPLKGNLKNLKFINEQGLYCLIFNSKMEKAKKFRKWVFEEILPSIRKNRYYVDPSIDSKKIKQLEEQLQEKDEQLNRLHNIQKELLSYKKRVTKEETVYIVSTANYARQGIFKIGRTKSQMKFRSSNHNVTHIKGDKVKVLKEFKVNDCVLIEKNIHTKLSGLLVEGEKEFFMCPYDLLLSLVELVVHNDGEENTMVNSIIDTVYKLKKQKFISEDWTTGIPKDMFKETLLITNGDEKLAELDISQWRNEHKQEFVSNCLKEYIKQENKVKEENFQIIWKTFQLFLIQNLSIPKSRFKVKDWKDYVKDEVNKKNELTIKWRK